MKSDTIAAISTAMSNAGISVIRISGDSALEITDKIFRSKTGYKKISEQKSHTIHYGIIVDEELLIDEVIVLLMRGPNSYTREDVVEIDCHGGIAVTQRVLQAVIHNGARVADPGEFTKRAFLNGRIDLSQAEAVIDLIQAKSEFAVRSSMSQLRGSVSEKIKEIRQNIIRDIAFIEAALDDPEHISLEGFDHDLLERVRINTKDLYILRKNNVNGRMLSEGIKTVIIGKPNVGKSSLMNLLVGEDRAIVTHVAGTTRDTLEETVQLGGLLLNIVDTAGIRETNDIVEKIGVEKAMLFLKDADLIIYVVDASIEFDENDYHIIGEIENKETVVLLNKSDLEMVLTQKDLEDKLNCKVIPFSTLHSKGLEELEDYIKNQFFEGKIEFNDEIYLTNARHQAAIDASIESLLQVEKSIQDHMSEDFYSIDLMTAYESLGEILGETVGEELVETIFRDFCMGK